jgi:hypothetical protein
VCYNIFPIKEKRIGERVGKVKRRGKRGGEEMRERDWKEGGKGYKDS